MDKHCRSVKRKQFEYDFGELGVFKFTDVSCVGNSLYSIKKKEGNRFKYLGYMNISNLTQDSFRETLIKWMNPPK